MIKDMLYLKKQGAHGIKLLIRTVSENKAIEP